MDKVEEFELVIEHGTSNKKYWRDLWSYRELFTFLAWRDLLVRYKQTVIGIVWSVIRPVLTMMVFTMIFGKLAKLPAGNVPYPILIFAAMLPWQLFSSSLSDISNSLLANSGMISKIYFPRLIIPTSTMIVCLVDFLISFIILIILMIYYNFVPDWRIITLPVLLLLSLAAALGPGLWLAALNVKYRDFKYIVPFIIQIGFYISPVGFSSNVIPQNLRLFYSINPMVGVIDGFRWAILGGQAQIYWPGFLLSLLLITLILWGGIQFFRKTERNFADII